MDSCFAACPWRLEAELGGILWRGELQVSRGIRNARGQKVMEGFTCVSKSDGEGQTDRQRQLAWKLQCGRGLWKQAHKGASGTEKPTFIASMGFVVEKAALGNRKWGGCCCVFILLLVFIVLKRLFSSLHFHKKQLLSFRVHWCFWRVSLAVRNRGERSTSELYLKKILRTELLLND